VRIVHVIARFNQGGTAGWLSVLIEGQRLEGSDVILLAGNVEANEKEDLRFSELDGVRIQGLGRSISLIQDIRATLALRKILIEIDPDIVNTHTAKAGLIGRLAARSISSRKIAIVHTFHGHILYGYFGRIRTEFFVLLEKILSGFTDVILVSGLKVKNELLEKHIGKEPQYIVVRPGVPPITFLSRSDVRQKLSISQDKVTVGWLGRLTEIKRPDRVLELAEQFPNYLFLVGGEGEMLESLRKDAPQNVILTGWTSPAEIWSASDIALLTSDNEAQPISLIEAALAGLPLIGENVGSVSEVIQNSSIGFLTHDLNSRIKAIEVLATNPELRLQMGEVARMSATELFGVDQFLKAHRQAYEKAIEMRSR
jgi:glycosyltransferase involved in cell wall biosynthesis